MKSTYTISTRDGEVFWLTEVQPSGHNLGQGMYMSYQEAFDEVPEGFDIYFRDFQGPRRPGRGKMQRMR